MITHPSNAMPITAEHLRIVTAQNIHMVHHPHDGDQIESAACEAAALLEYHVAVFDGRVIRTDLDIVRAACDAFNAPDWVKEASNLGWAQAEDAMWDLPGVFDPPYIKKGVVVILRDPEPLLLTNLVGFVWLVDTLSVGAQFQIRQGFPLHIVIGPLPNETRYGVFLRHLRIAEHFCAACVSSKSDE